MKELNPYSIESSELVEQTFNFWFNDNNHIRSPFPEYIHSQLKVLASEKFYKWVNNLNEKAKDEINDEVIAEKFEEIIFEIAKTLVMTEDEKITILYPFLPRIDDSIYEDAENKKGESNIIDRSIINEGDYQFLKIRLKKKNSEDIWETSFELPA